MKPVFKSIHLTVFTVLVLSVLSGWAHGAVSFNPPTAETWINQGNEAYQQAEYDEALSDYQKALELDSRNSFALYAQGLTLVKMGKWKEAASAFRKAVETDPANPKSWLGLGWADEKTGKRADAVESYQKIFQLECESRDRVLAAKHLSHLGVSPAVVSTAPPETPVAPPEAKKIFKWLSLDLEAGIGNDTNLNAATTVGRLKTPSVKGGFTDFPGQVQDGYNNLAASLGIVSGPPEDPRARVNTFCQAKSFFNSTTYDIQNFLGKAVLETPFLRSFRVETGLGGESDNQAQGVNYSSGFGWVGLKLKLDSTRASVAYTFTQETFPNFPLTPAAQGSALGLLSPNDSNHRVDALVGERLLPWLTLTGQYQFKDNQAAGTFYQYLSSGFGGGAEFFFFAGDHLISGLQLNYMSSMRQYSTVDFFLNLKQRDAVDLFTAQLDFPFQTGWSAELYYRSETDNSNIIFFSYSDQVMGLSFSYNLL